MKLNKHLGILIAVILCAAFTGTNLFAKNADIVTKDGRHISGPVESESTQMVTILVAGIKTKINRDDIESIVFSASIEEQYREKRKELQDDDLDGRYNLARWLYENSALKLAKSELDSLTAKFPDDSRVSALRNIVISRLKVDNRTGKPSSRNKNISKNDKSNKSPMRELAEKRLDGQQINLIKVYELDTDLSKTKIIIPKPVINEFLEKYIEHDAVPKGSREIKKFRAAKGHQQLNIIFAARAREFYSQVQIKQDPSSITEFRKSVHPRTVIKYCASCHSNTKDNSMYLFNIQPATEKTVYTNFYILNSYSSDSGQMIDRDIPENSLLLQYSLPKNYSQNPHPNAKGFQPAFLSPEDPNYQRIAKWIAQLYIPAPDYGFKYSPPYTKPRISTEIQQNDTEIPTQ